MNERARRILLATCAAALLLVFARPAAPAPFDADSARAKAHALTPFVLRDEPGPPWREFDDRMRAALRDSAGWAAALHSVVSQVGARDSVLREEVSSPEPGVFVVDAHCRFAKSSAPLEMIFAFDADGRVSGFLVRPDRSAPATEYPSRHLDYRTRASLRLPVRGEWLVFWGGRTVAKNHHAIARDQRFAMDLLMVRDGRTHAGDGKALTDYYCYGQRVIAPAAGTVVWTRDSLPDQVPGAMDPNHATGNSLILDLGGGEYMMLAHLQPGSLRVRVGDRVNADAELGRCGNSGNSSEPHLHVHLQDSPRPFDADGLPAQWVDLMVDGRRVDRAEIERGQVVSRAR